MELDFDPTRRTAVIVHGFVDTTDAEHFSEMKNKLLESVKFFNLSI